MALLSINFEKVPDHFEPIPAGIYEAEIISVPQILPTADGKSTKVVVEMKVTTEGDQKDKQITDHISVKMQTTLKNLFQSAGVSVGSQGGDTADLLNKIVKIKIAVENYTDKQTQEVRETNRVKEYLFSMTN